MTGSELCDNAGGFSGKGGDEVGIVRGGGTWVHVFRMSEGWGAGPYLLCFFLNESPACFTADLLQGKVVSNSLGSLMRDELLCVMALFTKWSDFYVWIVLSYVANGCVLIRVMEVVSPGFQCVVY